MKRNATEFTAARFVGELKKHRLESEHHKIRRYFKADDPENRVIGVRMKQVFDLAKVCTDMPLDEIEVLLESPYYEARMGAVSIMDFRVQRKKITEPERRELFFLYLRRHDRINNWDFMDRAAPRVIGGYLYECRQPRDILYKLVRSANPWERRTAIVSTAYFLRKKEAEDTFRLAEILIGDGHEYVQKAVGTWLRQAGQVDPKQLAAFLEKHAAGMPRTTLSTAMEKLSKEQKAYYRGKQPHPQKS